MLTIIKPFQKTFAFTRTQSPCFESGFVQFESGFLKVKSGIFKHESGFFSSQGPGFSRVRIFFESESGSESGFRSMPVSN
jgi:hypothetical protein